MTFLIIIAGLIVLFGYLLFTSVVIRLRYEETGKTASVAYSLIDVSYDIAKKTGLLTLALIPVYRFDLTKKKAKAAKKKSEKKEAKEKKEKGKRGKKRFRLSDIKLEYLVMAKSLMGGVRIKELLLRVSGGFMEPFYTGKMFAYYCAARGMYPSLMSHIEFRPDFSSGKLMFEGKGLVSLKMFYIFRFVFGLLADRVKEKLNNLFIIRKKGTSYV